MQTALQKEKELLKSNQEKVLREKTNQQTNSNAIEVMNNRVTDSVERGFKPSWVLEETAKHLALRTLETEDDKWLEMIHYLTTQKGPEGETSDLRKLGPNSYGKTLKGKTIIFDTMKKLRAKQAQKDKNAITLFNYQQKELKLDFQRRAALLYVQKGSDGWDEKWTALILEASNKGMSGVVKGEKENIENLKTDFRTITDAEMQDATTSFIKGIPSKDLLDTNFEFLFIENGVTLSEKQEGDLKSRIDSLRDYDKIKEVKNIIEDSGALIDKMLESEQQMRFPHVKTWGASSGLDQAIREQKRGIEEQIKNIYVNHLEKQREEGGKAIPYNMWDKDSKEEFLKEVEDTLDSIVPKQNKNGTFSGQIYDNIARAFEENRPPILERDKAIWIKTLRANRSDFEGVIETGGKLTPSQQQRYDEINEELRILDLKGETEIKKTKEEAKVLRERRLLTITSDEKRDIKLNKRVAATLIAGAKQGKEFTEDAINNLKDEAQVRFGTAAEAKVQRWLKAIVAPEDTHASKRISKWYGGMVRSIFPGFFEGFLESTLRFDRERKLEKVPEKAIRLIDQSTENARLIIEDMMGKEVDRIRKPYKLWTNEQRNAFTKDVKKALTKPNKEQIKIYKKRGIKKPAFGNKHLSQLRALMPRQDQGLSTTSKNLYEDLKGKNKNLTQLTKDEAEAMYDIYIPDGPITGSGLVSHKARLKALGLKLKTYKP